MVRQTAATGTAEHKAGRTGAQQEFLKMRRVLGVHARARVCKRALVINAVFI